MSINYPTLAHFRHFSSLLTNLRSTFVEKALQISPFYAKQSQFKPIQSQFKPKQTQFKPNLIDKSGINIWFKEMLIGIFQPHIIEIMPTAIESRQKSTNPPATIVVIIASSLRRSRMIPIVPTIAEAKTEKIISGPTRAAKGLPQPGRSTNIAHIVPAAIPSRIADIFPNRILTISEQVNKVFYNLSLSAVVESVNCGIF